MAKPFLYYLLRHIQQAGIRRIIIVTGHLSTKFGTLVTDHDHQLVRVDEKVPAPVTNLINAGLYRFQPDIFKVADKIGLSPRGEYEITDAITALAQRREVKVVPLQDYWIDFGRPEDIILAEDIVVNHYRQA